MVTRWPVEYAAEVANERLDPEVVRQSAAGESKRWAEVSDTVFSRFVALAREGEADGTR